MRFARPTASGDVLTLLRAMYFIPYVDRPYVDRVQRQHRGHRPSGRSRACPTPRSAWYSPRSAIPNLVFQGLGGWFGGRFGARRVLTGCGVVRALATIMTGLVGGLDTLLLARALLGFCEGATFPAATRAMAGWMPGGKSGVPGASPTPAPAWATPSPRR